jgi:hypothetical protein
MIKQNHLPKILAFCFTMLTFAGYSQSTFSSVRALFSANCTNGCHNATDPTGNLDLTGTDDEVYQRLVNATPTNPAAASRNWKRIKPGYPDRSFLLRKCNNNLYQNAGIDAADLGSPMPSYPQPAMQPQEIELIRQWVYKGAPQTGTVVNINTINTYYTEGGINSVPNPPPVPTEPGAFQLHLGKIFLEPQTEVEYFIKYDLELADFIRVNRLDLHMAPQSHHFILYKLVPNAVNFFPEGLRLQNPLNGAGSSSGYNTMVNAWQISYDTYLPQGTAYKWDGGSVLDMNFHLRNYSTDSILASEVYINVYTVPNTTDDEIMYSDLITNTNIAIPNNNQPVTFTVSDYLPSETRYWNLWQLTSHTHKYGKDYDLFTRTASGQQGEQIYEGFYDIDYTFNQGYYNFSHPPIRQFEPLYQLNPRLGMIQQATFQNNGPETVYFGLTTLDEMMVYYYQYTLGDLIDNPNAIAEIDQLKLTAFPNPSNGQFALQFTAATAGNAEIKLTDLAGRVLITEQKSVTQGNNTYNFDYSNQLSQGIYLVEVTAGQERSVRRISIK